MAIPQFLRSTFRVEPKELSQTDPRLAEIFGTMVDAADVDRFIHGQFLEGSEDYAAKYSAVPYFKKLIIEAFEKSHITRVDWDGAVVLDIGSGAGNSVLPLFEICPNAHVIASDISVPLLAILKADLQKKGYLPRCTIVQMSAEDLQMTENSVDLVVGAAILHHLFLPEKCIEVASRALKPGGRAIFFEPLENGNTLLGVLFRQIISDLRSRLLPRSVQDLMKCFIQDIDFRKGRDKTHPDFLRLDDKWIFTKAYFFELADRFGFSKCLVNAINTVPNMFQDQLEMRLRVSLNLEPSAVPNWVWRKVCDFDTFFSQDMKEDLLIDGTIVMVK